MRAQPRGASTPWVAIRCQTCVLNDESRKLRQVRSAPQRAAVCRLRAQRLVKSAKKKGIERYITPLKVVPMIPVEERLPCSTQLLE